MYKLKITLVSSLFLCFSFFSKAQIGISAAYTSVGVDFENEKDLTAFAPTYSVGLDYWFRLKNYRVEFYPGARFMQSADETFNNKLGAAETLNHRFSIASAKLDIRVYPFDFDGDCDCPTWSKDGDFFEKGVFVFASTSGGQLSKKREGSVSGNSDDSEFLFTYGGGLGLDIGLSDYLTISPFVMYERSGNTTWDLHPCESCNKTPDETTLNPFSAGIHVQYRWKKY